MHRKLWARSTRNRGWKLRSDKGITISQGLKSVPEAWLSNPAQDKIGIIRLPRQLFAQPVRADILNRLLEWEKAAWRNKSVATRTRAQVRASKRKPFKQKGTGRARQGQVSSPLNRGGGKAHGKTDRSYRIEIQKKLRKSAIKSALSARFQEDRVVIWQHAKLEQPKTKEFIKALDELATDSVLVVDGPFFEKNFVMGGRNLPHVKMVNPSKVTLHDILKKDKIVITLPALNLLNLWLSKSKEDQKKWKEISNKVFSGNAEKFKAKKGKKAYTWKSLPLYREEGKEYKDDLTTMQRKARAKYARKAEKKSLRASTHARIKWKVKNKDEPKLKEEPSSKAIEPEL
jgi:large subunit ribosomal protein L4